MAVKVGELCAGYGGISMGLALAGEQIDLRWLAEVDRTLDPLHPAGVPNLGDITAVDWTDPTIERVDLLTAGFPCQPFSAAGAQLAEADHRYLWPAVRDAVAALLPPRVLLENVRNLVSMRKGEVWRTILDDLTHLGYDVTWLTLGACRVGTAHHRHRVFALATHTQWSEPRVTRLDVAECGAKAVDLLPSPAARDGSTRGEGDAQFWARRLVTRGPKGRPLGAELALLPTPGAGDAKRGWSTRHGGNRSDEVGSLAGIGQLLPSPRASVDAVGGPGQRGSSGDLALPSTTQPVNFDRFQDAVNRHAAIFDPPPAPTEPNRNGAPRLSAAFAEWLMCIPAGHVTDALPRTQALRAIGNGVCPPQLAAAWHLLTNPTDVDKPNDTSIGFGAMTTSTGSTSSDVKEIQDRNAAARGRVIEATMALGVTVDPALIQAAMMELAAVWREEAAHVTAAKRKGHVSIAKEYTMAASRLAGFAVGLTTRPVTTVNIPTPPLDNKGGGCGKPDCDFQVQCGECFEASERQYDEWYARAGYNRSMHRIVIDEMREQTHAEALAEHQTRDDRPSDAELPGMWSGADLTGGLADALPDGDPVAAVFSSPLDAHPPQCDCGRPECAALSLTGDEPIGTKVTVGGIEFTKIGTNPFGADQSEEQNLRDIIGPLGASSVTATVDHPFTNPGVPWLNQRRAVEVVPYAQLPVIAAALAPRDHVSHSYVESYEGCSLSAMLRDASRAGHIGAARPSWSQIGGKAFHNAVELIERLALSGVSTADDPEALWAQHFDAAVKEQLDALVGTPYADSATWYISNRGKEGFDWWRVEGAKMLGLYVRHHTTQWRAANPTFLLADTTPVIELPYTMSIRSLDEVRGLTAQGFIDRATLNLTTYSLTVLDYKTGSRDPESTFQLGEYGHALLMAMGIAQEPADRPILGQYWLARKGIYTDPVPVVTRHPLAELQYRYDAAARGTAAKIFAPHATNLCKSCSVTDYCPTQAGRS